MTAEELIAQERQKQIDKGHNQDEKYIYRDLEMAATAIYLKDERWWPKTWDIAYFKKYMTRDRLKQLIIVGALYQAEEDRIGVPNLFKLEIERTIKEINERL